MIYHLLSDVFTGLMMSLPISIPVVLILYKFHKENPHD